VVLTFPTAEAAPQPTSPARLTIGRTHGRANPTVLNAERTRRRARPAFPTNNAARGRPRPAFLKIGGAPGRARPAVLKIDLTFGHIRSPFRITSHVSRGQRVTETPNRGCEFDVG
jgi:hypothetical protein